MEEKRDNERRERVRKAQEAHEQERQKRDSAGGQADDDDEGVGEMPGFGNMGAFDELMKDPELVTLFQVRRLSRVGIGEVGRGGGSRGG